MPVTITTFGFVVGIVFTIVSALGFAFIPTLVKSHKEKREAQKAIFKDFKKIHSGIKTSLSAYHDISSESYEDLRKIRKNKFTPKRLLKKLEDLSKIMVEYNDWISDLEELIMPSIKSEIHNFRHNKKWISAIEEIDNNTYLTSSLTHLICKDKLNINNAQEFLFEKFGRDYEMHTNGGSKAVRLKDFVDSDDFHDLINDLERFQDYKSVEGVRRAEENIRKEAKDLREWVNKKSK